MPSQRPRKARSRLLTCGLVLVIVALVAVALLIFRRSNFVNGLQPTQLVISAPSDGSTVPLHSTVAVVGDAISAVGVRDIELWVNGQEWGNVQFDSLQKEAHHVWAWTPSGEGKHVLLLRAHDKLGRTVETAALAVYASSKFDIRFPLSYTARGGETLAGLASSYGTDPDALAVSNPGLDPNAPLPGGTQLTIPIPISNADPAAPQDGQQPVAPAAPLPGGSSDGGTQGPPGAPLDLSHIPLFSLTKDSIILKVPVQQIYAYVSLASQPWFRIPQDEFTFLESPGSTFDIKPYLTPSMLEGLPSPTSLEADVWGWSGGQLVYLGRQTGVLDSNTPEGGILTSSKLEIVGKIRDSVSYETQWTIPSPIPGYYQGFKQGFRWSTSLQGVTGGIWQVSSQPFTPGQLWAFPGQLNFGKLPPPKTILTQSIPLFPVESEVVPVTFSLDFAGYLDLPPSLAGSGVFELFQKAVDQVAEAVESPNKLHRWDPTLPRAFYVRVLPVMGKDIGTPSNAVVVTYGPPEPQPVTEATGPLYDVQIVKFTPYRPANSDYAACMILTEDIKTCHTVWLLDHDKLSQVTNLHTKAVLENNENGDLKYYLDTYGSQLPPGTIYSKEVCDVSFPKGTRSCGCPGVPCSSGSSCSFDMSDWGTCVAEGGKWLLDQASAAANWISEQYAAVKSFAIDAIMKYTGIQDLCSAAGGEAQCRVVVEAAVDYGLAAVGLPPTIPNFDELMSQGQEYLVSLAVQEIRDRGFPCDEDCESAIKAGYGQIQDWASNSGSGAAGSYGGMPQQVWKPDPQGVEQPAMLTVKVTRRIETAAIPDAQTAGCSLNVWNSASNSSYGQTLEGAPFSGVGMKIPPMAPGASVIIPVGLTRIPWQAPEGFSMPSGQIGAIVSAIAESGVGQWTLLYYGSTITFDLRSQGFNTTGADGKPVFVKCMDDFKYPVTIPPQP